MEVFKYHGIHRWYHHNAAILIIWNWHQKIAHLIILHYYSTQPTTLLLSRILNLMWHILLVWYAKLLKELVLPVIPETSQIVCRLLQILLSKQARKYFIQKLNGCRDGWICTCWLKFIGMSDAMFIFTYVGMVVWNIAIYVIWFLYVNFVSLATSRHPYICLIFGRNFWNTMFFCCVVPPTHKNVSS